MLTLTPDQFKQKYGQQEYNMLTLTNKVSQPKPGLFSRISSDISQAGQDVNTSINDTSKSTLNAATGAVAAGFNAIPKVASEFLPESLPQLPFGLDLVASRKGWEKLGSGFGTAINWLGEKLGNVPAIHDWVIKNPEAAKGLIDKLQIVQNAGQISGDILTADMIAKGTQGTVDMAGTEMKRFGQAVSNGVTNMTEAVGDTFKSGGDIIKNTLYGDKPAAEPTNVDKFLEPDLKGRAKVKAIKTGKVEEGQGLLGKRDFSSTVNNLDEMKQTVSDVPGIQDAKTNLEANNLIKKYNTRVHEDLMNKLATERAFTNPSLIKSELNVVRQSLNENPTMVGDAAAAGEKMISKFENLVDEYGYNGYGIMKARIALDEWAGAAKKFSTPANNGATAALRAVRDAANKIAADLSPNTATQALLRKNTMLYRAQDIIAPKAAAEGSTAVQRFIKKHPVLNKAAKIVGAGTVAGKAAQLGETMLK